MKALFALILLSHGWALNYSSPVVLSEINLFELPQEMALSLNEKGDAALIWRDFQYTDEKEHVKVAIQELGKWSTRSIASTAAKEASRLSCNIDIFGNVTALWKSEKKESETWQATAKPHSADWEKARTLEVDKYVRIFPFEKDKLLVFSRAEALRTPGSWSSSYELRATELSISSDQVRTEKLENLSFSLWDAALGMKGDQPRFVFWQKAYSNVLAFGTSDFVTKIDCATSWRKEDGSWSVPEIVSLGGSSFGHINNLSVAVDSADNICVVGTTEVPGEGDRYAVWAWTRSAEGKWSDPVFISPHHEDWISEVRIAADSRGNFLVVWEVPPSNTESAIYSAYKPKDQAWIPSAPVTSPLEHNADPLLQGSSTGFALVWKQLRRGKHASVQSAQFSSKTKSWSLPKQLSPPGEQCVLSSFALNAKGKGIVIWTHQTHVTEAVLEATDVTLE